MSKIRELLIVALVLVITFATILSNPPWASPLAAAISGHVVGHVGHVASSSEGRSSPSTTTSEAELIISRAYEETFAHVASNCPHNRSLSECLSDFHKRRLAPDGDAVDSVPWWFRTLVRDGISHPNRHWHRLQSVDPPLRMCTIEKVGTTQWRKVFCRLLFPEGGLDCGKAHHPRPGPPPDAPRIAFLRDPLERFLSAYLDKCVEKRNFHCSPRNVFKDDPTNELLETIRDDKKQLFASYADAMPLKWNMHFVPQAMYCDGLYRRLGSYDFVGTMGRAFYSDLAVLRGRYGRNSTKFADVIDAVFKMGNRNLTDRRRENVGVETRAPERVLEYYTPHSLRRVLQYVAMDYKSLGMSVPEWAHEMLRKDALRAKAMGENSVMDGAR